MPPTHPSIAVCGVLPSQAVLPAVKFHVPELETTVGLIPTVASAASTTAGGGGVGGKPPETACRPSFDCKPPISRIPTYPIPPTTITAAAAMALFLTNG